MMTFRTILVLTAVCASTLSFAGERDIGCWRSASECRAACGNETMRWERYSPPCLDALESFHCWCVTPDIAPVTPPPADAQFVGCRRDPGECRMSCEHRDGIAVRDEQLCPAAIDEPLACYCPRG